MDANLKRGIISNLIGLAILLAIGIPMNLWKLALLALAIQWGVFLIHGLPQNSEKFFDASGSVTYLALVIAALALKPSPGVRAIVSSSLVIVWCVRLGSYLFARILRDGKDSRFDELKLNWLRFLSIWTIQAVWVFLVSSPALAMTSSDVCKTKSLGYVDAAGLAVWLFAFFFEVVADGQKNAFRTDPANAGKFITTGLWAYSRHPNYFGEILMWIGMCVAGSNCFRGWEFLAWLSPLTTILLLTKLTGVPMLEKKGEKQWGHLPEYQWYMKHTPCIFPRFCRPPPYDEAYVRLEG